MFRKPLDEWHSPKSANCRQFAVTSATEPHGLSTPHDQRLDAAVSMLPRASIKSRMTPLQGHKASEEVIARLDYPIVTSRQSLPSKSVSGVEPDLSLLYPEQSVIWRVGKVIDNVANHVLSLLERYPFFLDVHLTVFFTDLIATRPPSRSLLIGPPPFRTS